MEEKEIMDYKRRIKIAQMTVAIFTGISIAFFLVAIFQLAKFVT